MLRANFFYKFFKHKGKNDYKIIKWDENKNNDIEGAINLKIIEIDKKISENTKALVEAQFVKLRSNFSKSNNFIEKVGQNFYKVKLEDSINWYQKEIKELILKRKELQTQLEKTQGIFWLNQIKRFIKIVCIGFFILLSLFVFFSGFMIIIYLLPIILLIILVYLLSTKNIR